MAKKKKVPNKELVDFTVEARKQHLTYGQLQKLETIELIRQERKKRKEQEAEGQDDVRIHEGD